MKKSEVLLVEGMSCIHCENSVKSAVGKLPGVDNVVVDLKCKNVTVYFDDEKVTEESIICAIEDQGYDVIK
ncbi:MAG: copper ion binding protein [Oscillospiraceae bacterium]|nr:copper ion binding protein [Oscillospiraceae bacterium]